MFENLNMKFSSKSKTTLFSRKGNEDQKSLVWRKYWKKHQTTSKAALLFSFKLFCDIKGNWSHKLFWVMVCLKTNPILVSYFQKALKIFDKVNKTNIIWYHLQVESKNIYIYKWTYLQNRNRLTDIENKLMVTKEEMGREGIN